MYILKFDKDHFLSWHYARRAMMIATFPMFVGPRGYTFPLNVFKRHFITMNVCFKKERFLSIPKISCCCFLFFFVIKLVYHLK